MAAARVTLAAPEQLDDAIGLAIWKRSQQYRIHDAENRGVRPYPQGQREERGNGERRRRSKRSECIPAILNERLHRCPS